MESFNLPFSSFTLTQPFLGAPLQFFPALGSVELEQLIDAYVTGSSSKQGKLSEVTIDFYNNATVDLNTGALVKTYYVYNLNATSPWDFEHSPNDSFSSTFSPQIYTPSPGSSSTNLADSAYGGSFSSTTPPTGSSEGSASGRVAKKTKKETKKAAERRLPGFSIMTKDGVDVTNSAGRGTKTREQREHAHLIRIMKACSNCKRKKVKCDPSHRREQTNMSRTSTSATSSSGSSSSSSSCSSRPNRTPSMYPPSLSRESTNASSQQSMESFDDFVLFPEDTDFSLPADYDLGQFNFDIGDVGSANLGQCGSTTFMQSQSLSLFDPMAEFSLDDSGYLDPEYSIPSIHSAQQTRIPNGPSRQQRFSFSRPADLERHYTNVHSHEEGTRQKHFCGHANCKRSTKAFAREDHFREHLRDNHQEDIGNMNLGQSQCSPFISPQPDLLLWNVDQLPDVNLHEWDNLDYRIPNIHNSQQTSAPGQPLPVTDSNINDGAIAPLTSSNATVTVSTIWLDKRTDRPNGTNVTTLLLLAFSLALFASSMHLVPEPGSSWTSTTSNVTPPPIIVAFLELALIALAIGCVRAIKFSWISRLIEILIKRSLFVAAILAFIDQKRCLDNSRFTPQRAPTQSQEPGFVHKYLSIFGRITSRRPLGYLRPLNLRV